MRICLAHSVSFWTTISPILTIRHRGLREFKKVHGSHYVPLHDRIPWGLRANLNPVLDVLEFWPYRRWVKELSKLIWPTLGSTPHRSEVSDSMALFALMFDVVWCCLIWFRMNWPFVFLGNWSWIVLTAFPVLCGVDRMWCTFAKTWVTTSQQSQPLLKSLCVD